MRILRCDCGGNFGLEEKNLSSPVTHRTFRPLPGSYRRHASFFGAAAAALGLLGLSGWILGIPLLASIRSSYIPMAPLTAVSFLCFGGVLLVHLTGSPKGPVGFLAAIVSALLSAYGLIEIVEYLGIPVLSLEERMFPDPPMIGAIPSGRMSPTMAALLLLSGAVVPMLFLRDRGGERRKLYGDLAGCLGCLSAVTGSVFILSYLHGAPLLYGTSTIPMAAMTALAYLLLGTGQVLAAGPDGFPSMLFVGPSTRARLLRAFVSTAVGVVVAIDLAHVYAHEIFFKDNAFMSGVSITVFAVITGGLVAKVALKVGGDMDRSEEVRRGAEEALRESERKYRELLEHANSIILHWTRDGRIIFLNEFGQRFFGYSEEEIVGRHVVGTIVAESESTGRDLRPLMDQICADPVAFEQNVNENMRRNGEKVWIAWTNKVYLDDQGRVEGILSIGADITELKRAEEELRRSKAELIEAQRVGGLGNWGLDPKTGDVTWSEELYRIFGRDSKLPPPNFEEHAEILTPDSMEKTNIAIEKCMRSGEPYELDLEFVRPDGTRGWLIAHGEAKRDEIGRIVGLRGTVLDNTGKKKAEEQLRKRLNLESTLREIDAKILKGANFREVLGIACDAIVEMGYRLCWIGLAEPDFTVRPIESRGFDAGYLDRMTFRWDESPEGMGPTGIAIRTGRPYVCSDILTDGIYAPWRSEAVKRGFRSSASIPLDSGIGQALGILHVYVKSGNGIPPEDVRILETFAQQCTLALVSAKRIEEFRVFNRRLSSHIERMPLGYITHDREFRIVEFNPAAERIFGWSSAEAKGKHPFELMIPREMQAHVSAAWSKLYEGDDSSIDSVGPAIRKDGTTVNCEWFNTSLRDAAGAITGFTVLVHDITEKVHLEKQLRMAQKMESVGTLAGGIAHDFNNALTGIVGFGELLRMRMAGDEQASHDVDEILRCAERASTLTRQLLTYARRQVIEPVNLNLSALVADLMKLIGKVVGEHIEVKTSLDKNLPAIHADRGQIEQAVMNLCLNARDAMPEGGRLVVDTEDVYLEEEYVRHNPYMKKGRYALLTVSDTGVGMDEKTRERVFDPFFTTKGPDKGTGLGLAMVYGIVKQHGGFIHIYTEPGKGTAFKVYFPAIEAESDTVPAIRREEIARGGTETILLAEDEGAIRTLAERILTGFGYTVLVARNGEEAIEIFRKNNEIALAVLDVVMPRKGGKEAFEEMYRQNPRLKVIFMSGYSANGIHDSFVLIPGTPFLQKPFNPTTLARKVREVLDTQ